MQGVVLAGNKASEDLQAAGVDRVYLLTIGGETLLARMCRCLVQGGGCSRVSVLTQPEVPLPDMPEVGRAEYTGNPIHDIIECAKDPDGEGDMLLAAGDVPLVSPEAITALVEYAGRTEVDAVYHVVPRPDIERLFPHGKRTYLKTRSGTFTGGNVFWMRREWLLHQEESLKYLFANRKNLFALAKRFGLGTIIRLLLGTADIGYLERKVGRAINGRLSAAILPCPELAMDLDKLADLEAFREHLDEF